MTRGELAAIGVAFAAGAGAYAGTNDIQVTGYGSFDVSSGYVLYGARMNDEPCYWTYGELDVNYGKAATLGVSLWQNTDMTTRRKAEMRRMNEWDWGVFARTGFDLADDWRLEIEAGHIWYKYHGLTRAAAAAYRTMEEWYGRLSLRDPVVTPYFEGYYDHQVCKGAFLQAGLRREFGLPLGLTFMPDLSLGGGSRNYNACLYPPFDGRAGGGLAFVQFAGTLTYWFDDHFGVHAKLAWVSLVRDEIREAVSSSDGTHANDFVWGTIGVETSF